MVYRDHFKFNFISLPPEEFIAQLHEECDKYDRKILRKWLIKKKTIDERFKEELEKMLVEGKITEAFELLKENLKGKILEPQYADLLTVMSGWSASHREYNIGKIQHPEFHVMEMKSIDFLSKFLQSIKSSSK
jgi:tRNA nucleotidyltransferase/poly(A) polymerase